MSFWNLSDNTNAMTTGDAFESATKLEPIPAGSVLPSIIEEAGWDEYEGNRHIKLKWVVIEGEHKKRVIFQKIHVFGNPKAKDVAASADKAKRMLAAIATNAGGGLFEVQGEPSDMHLMQHLCNKMMSVRVDVWEIDGKSGNFIDAVSPRKKPSAQVPTAKQTHPQQPAMGVLEGEVIFDDDIPF